MSKIDAFAAKQFNDWNGPSGENWVKRQEEQDRVLAPVSALLFAAAALAPGERALDVGCGCGDTALEAARQVGASGEAFGVDISTPMVARAIARATHEKLGARFAVADAADYPFPPSHFDALISRFGVMFFPEPGKAFANLRKAVKPGGRIAFVCWQALKMQEWMLIPLRAALTHVPRLPEPDPDEPGPFAFADTGKVTRVLEGAGFSQVSFQPAHVTLDIAAGQGFEAGLASAISIGPASRALREASETQRAAGIAEIRKALEPFARGPSLPLEAKPWVVTARG